MTTTYWNVGRRIVEHEQRGRRRADYGQALLKHISRDLTQRLGRGYSERNLELMRRFYLTWPISQTVSAKSDLSLESRGNRGRFRLPWSHYVRLLSIRTEAARRFYEQEALRGGWTLRQLERQVGSQFYERTLRSTNREPMVERSRRFRPIEESDPEEQIKDPFVLEFLDLKYEYSENDMESALISHLESFLLELGNDFAFMGRQRRLRVGDQWHRIDLLFFHRGLRSLVIIDLKLGELTAADAGQMHLYLNYAKAHWTRPDENPPVGLILCAQKDAAVAHYALEGLPNRIVAAEYRTVLPRERLLAREIQRSQEAFERRRCRQLGHRRRTP